MRMNKETARGVVPLAFALQLIDSVPQDADAVF